MLKGIGKFIVALNGNASRTQVAAGIAWGVWLGLVPLSNFFGIVLFIVSFLFTHNHGAKIFGMALIKLLSPLIAPGVDLLGWQILHIEALQPFYTTMFNMPFVPFTRFNNTLVAGGLVAGIVLWFPVFFASRAFIPHYRNIIAPKIRNSKIVKHIAKSPLLKAVDIVVKKFL